MCTMGSPIPIDRRHFPPSFATARKYSIIVSFAVLKCTPPQPYTPRKKSEAKKKDLDIYYYIPTTLKTEKTQELGIETYTFALFLHHVEDTVRLTSPYQVVLN